MERQPAEAARPAEFPGEVDHLAARALEERGQRVRRDVGPAAQFKRRPLGPRGERDGRVEIRRHLAEGIPRRERDGEGRVHNLRRGHHTPRERIHRAGSAAHLKGKALAARPLAVLGPQAHVGRGGQRGQTAVPHAVGEVAGHRRCDQRGKDGADFVAQIHERPLIGTRLGGDTVQVALIALQDGAMRKGRGHRVARVKAAAGRVETDPVGLAGVQRDGCRQGGFRPRALRRADVETGQRFSRIRPNRDPAARAMTPVSDQQFRVRPERIAHRGRPAELNTRHRRRVEQSE